MKKLCSLQIETPPNADPTKCRLHKMQTPQNTDPTKCKLHVIIIQLQNRLETALFLQWEDFKCVVVLKKYVISRFDFHEVHHYCHFETDLPKLLIQ